MGHRDAALSRLTRAALALLALACFAPAAHAADFVFRNITWPRHDRKTGFLESELHAVQARTKVAARNIYACTGLEYTTYVLEDAGGTKRIRKERTLTADHGTYHHLGRTKSTIQLDGHVAAVFHGREPMRIATDRTTIDTARDTKRNAAGEAVQTVHSQHIHTRSKVTMVSATRTLTGEGLDFRERTIENEKKEGSGRHAADRSYLELERNIRMTIRGLDVGGALPTLDQPSDASKAASPITISCVGPFVYDRLTSTARFQNHVVLQRGETRMTCRTLTLHFRELAASRPDAPKLDLRELAGEGNVRVAGKDQQFRGDRLRWVPATQEGTLVGRPARMAARNTTATADHIVFDQKTERITCTGNAQVEIILEPE